MSKVVVFDQYGEADVLHVIDTPTPYPEPGQVRVHVRACGVQPFDCLFRRGDARQWVPATFPQRLGNEFAGVIDSVGEGVEDFSVGDEVLGWSMLDAYAEHVAVGTEQIVAKPPGMPWTEAGVISASGQTAATALEELGVGKGDVILVHGAAGGVGTFAVQIAKARGATVIGTASERNHDYLSSLGAVPVIYGDGLEERVRDAAPRGIDAALVAVDTLEALQVSAQLVGERQRIGTVAFQPTAVSLGIRRLSTKRSTSQLTTLTKLYSEGDLRVVIQHAYPLIEAAAAHRSVETGHVRGKIVLRA